MVKKIINISSDADKYALFSKILIFTAFLYTAIRASVISIFHDEALTYLNHAFAPFFNIVTFSQPIMSNNHLLNTILVKICVGFFGLSEFVIRIPALIAHCIYLIGTYKVIKLILRKELVFFGMCLALFNPIVLELFSASRGYALGLGFLSFSIYYLLLSIKNTEPISFSKYMSLSVWMLVLATLSHLVFLQVYLSLIMLISIYFLAQSVSLFKQKQSLKSLFNGSYRRLFYSIISGALILLIIYANPIIKMRSNSDDFAYGGTTGFWQDTVTSVIEAVLYGKIADNIFLVCGIKIFIAVLLTAAIGLLFSLWRKKQKIKTIDYFILGMLTLLMGCVLVVVLQWEMLHIKYVTTRRAAYFIPIFIILITCLWERSQLIKNGIKKNLINGLFFFLIGVSFIHLIRCANFSYYFLDPKDSSTKSVMQYLKKINKDKGLAPNSKSIGIDWNFEPAVNFYKVKYNLNWLKWAHRGGADDFYNYYYLCFKKDETFDKYHPMHNYAIIRKYKLKVIKKFDLSKSVLAIR